MLIFHSSKDLHAKRSSTLSLRQNIGLVNIVGENITIVNIISTFNNFVPVHKNPKYATCIDIVIINIV